MDNILLIGNSGILLDQALGEKIDAFNGEIVRFNNFVIEGFEKYVGHRTDWWFGNSAFWGDSELKAKRIYIAYTRPPESHLKYDAKFIGDDIIQKTRDQVGTMTPAGGTLAIMYFLDKQYNIFICGYDWYHDKRIHYFENEINNNILFKNRYRHHHNRDAEETWTKRLIGESKVQWFN